MKLTQFVDNDSAIPRAFEQREGVFYVIFDEQQVNRLRSDTHQAIVS